MRTIQCPKCLAYMQGDFKNMAALPVHYTARRWDTEMKLAESLTEPGVCPASWQLVQTAPSEKDL